MHSDHGVERWDVAHAAAPVLPALPSRRLVTALSLMGMVVLAGLLGSFLLVVQGAVKRGESMRQEAGSQAAAVWRCNVLHSPPQRVACRAEAGLPRAVSVAPKTE